MANETSDNPRRLRSSLKGHGGKYYLTPRLVELQPEEWSFFVDPTCFTCSLFFSLPMEDKAAILCDLNGDVTNFWKVLQHQVRFEQFKRIAEVTPFSEVEFKEARARLADGYESAEGEDQRVRRALDFFIVAKQSLGGRRKAFSPATKTRLRRGMQAEVSAWLSSIEGLADVHKHLQRAYIHSPQDVCKTIEMYDASGVWLYVDPPYHPSTRVSTETYGQFEMSHEEHERLLETLLGVKEAKVLVSGYACPLYDKGLSTWQRREFDMANHAAGGKSKRRMTEVVWSNY